MKGTLVACAAALAAGASCAQSSLVVYGVVDVAASRYWGEGNGHRTQLISGGNQQSRIGLRGREDLGGRPFGDGTPPGPVSPGEQVPPDHTPLR